MSPLPAFPRDHWRRCLHLARAGLRYLTPAKAANLLHCEWEKLWRRPRVRSKPYIAVVDLTNTCNLRCPWCPTGSRRPSGRPPHFIDLDLVQGLLDAYGDHLLTAALFHWGEPLLHPRVADIVRMFHDRRIFTSLSSHLNLSSPQRLAAVAEAGLDYLIVSLSGASPAVYEDYHRRGDLALVLDHLRYLAAHKRRTSRRNPFIAVKYLLFRHNLHEVAAARSLTARAGADAFFTFPGGGPPDYKLPATPGPAAPHPFLPLCHQLWHTVVLHADGGVAPCCYLYFAADDFGRVPPESLEAIRNNPLSITARRLFSPRHRAALPPDFTHPCLKCEFVHAQPHLAAYLQANPHARRDHRTGGY